MNQPPSAPETVHPQAPRWQPLSAVDRRVVGVLVEKAKTTPETYPMSLSAVCTACNQKSNRAPVMQLDQEQVSMSLDHLRQLGAVGLIEGSGRVDKFRHYLYDWLGVDKVELAVMAELLLRGAQTEGELRIRASRMEPIADLPALRTVLTSLIAKNLVISLTPDGRGHIISHSLYRPQELERLQALYAQARSGVALTAEGEEPLAPAGAEAGVAASPAKAVSHHVPGQIDDLRAEVAQLRADMQELTAGLQNLGEEIHRLKAALGG